MNKKWMVVLTLVVVVVAFAAGVAIYRDRTGQQVAQDLQSNSQSLVRAHSPVFGNPDAKVTIVEFFDPACETCRAFYPIVKGIVASSFGEVRLVVRYAPLHAGSDVAIKILEAARKQGKYWEAVEKTLADQPRWADHHNPKPDLIWESIGGIGLDMTRARADAQALELDDLIVQDVVDMRALKVDKTPGFFVNGRPLEDFGVKQLQTLIEQERKKAKTP
jgi:protein-disulfide isomerase